MRTRALCVAVCLFVGTSAAAIARAAEPGAPPRRASVGRSPLGFNFSLGRGHDDNVLQLTRQTLDLFTRRPGPPRFLISQVGDMATIARGSLRWRARPWDRRETRLDLDAAFHRYDHDRVFDWQELELSASQELTASRRRPLTAELYGGRVPDYYLGEITDIDESVAAGRTVRHSLSYAQTTYGLRLRQELLRGRLEFGGALERIHREYNRHFLERMNDNDSWRLQAEATPFRGWDGSARVTWLRGDLNARGDLPDTLGVTDTDISYDHDGVGISLALPWGRGAWRGRFDGSFMPEVRRYTTDNKFDILRFGRENHRRDTRLRLTQRVWGPLDAVATWERLISRAEFHQGITFPAAQTNFDQEQFGVELRARWEFALR
ncbi:MAG TPA: hypothetical protein VI504_16575 [Candidatus Eisenbacteria bacterium]